MLYEGIVGALDELRAAGRRLGVCTSKRANGLGSAGVLRGYDSEAELKSAGAGCILRRTDELQSLGASAGQRARRAGADEVPDSMRMPRQHHRQALEGPGLLRSRRGATSLGLRYWLGAAIWIALSGCYPGRPVVRPKTDLTVVDAQGAAIAGADVTIATFRQPFAMPRTTVLTTYRTDASGVLKLRKQRKWQMQAMLPDAFGWYTWIYCIERAGYQARASEEVDDRIGPVTVVLEPNPAPSQCVWPVSDEQRYWEVEVTGD